MRIMGLRRRGITRYTDLAKKIGVSLATINRDAAAIDKMLVEELRNTVRDTYIARQLDEIAYLKAEANEAWEKSKQPEESMIARVKKKPAGGVDASGRPTAVEETSTEQRRRAQVGDPTFLHLHNALLKREADLLGLDALPEAQRLQAQVAAAKGRWIWCGCSSRARSRRSWTFRWTTWPQPRARFRS
jgi:hypothetical protein